jgi:Raf kinase inhibitor-like YbhB/YbcL family protein
MRRWMLVLMVGLVGLAACSSGGGEPRAEHDLPERIRVSSAAFADGAAIPPRFTCKGENVSPPLRWSGVPEGTAGIALVVDDPDAPRGTFVHWVLTGLDPASDGLAEGAVPAGARQLPNSDKKAGWTGPCPPGGPAHHYRFTVYALRQQPEVAGDADPEAAVGAIEAAATARGRLVGTFGR